MNQIDLFSQQCESKKLEFAGIELGVRDGVPGFEHQGQWRPCLIDVSNPAKDWTGLGRAPLWVQVWARKQGIKNMHRDVLVPALRNQMLEVMR